MAAQLLTRELLVHWLWIAFDIGVVRTSEAAALFFVGSFEVLEPPVAHVEVVCLAVDNTTCLVLDINRIVRFVYLYSGSRIFSAREWYHSLARVNIITG